MKKKLLFVISVYAPKTKFSPYLPILYFFPSIVVALSCFLAPFFFVLIPSPNSLACYFSLSLSGLLYSLFPPLHALAPLFVFSLLLLCECTLAALRQPCLFGIRPSYLSIMWPWNLTYIINSDKPQKLKSQWYYFVFQMFFDISI